MLICICDDEKNLRKSLRTTVETELQLVGVSYEINEFGSGEDLLGSLGSSEPDYILKPYREEKIREVLRMALDETERLADRYFLIEQKNRSLKIPLKNIFYFKSDRKKVSAVTLNGTEEFYGKLSDIENDLPDHFIRIHNRYLANLMQITDLGPASCICGGEELPVSRACRQQLAAAFARTLLDN